MKKNIIFCFIFLFLFAIIYEYKIHKSKLFKFFKSYFSCAHVLFSNFISIKKNCWDKDKYPIYDDKYPEIRFIDHASYECDIPGYPVIYIKDDEATNWVQIVEINIPPPKNESSIKKQNWSFFDSTSLSKKINNPFYYKTYSNQIFWDNPGWSCFINPFKKNNLNWKAITFSVLVKKNKFIFPRFAFSWGYMIDYSNFIINPIKPKRIDISIWEEFRPYFVEKFPEWDFEKILKEEKKL